MSRYEYRESLKIAADDPSFYALIMAAMRKADTTNGYKLRTAWPDVWKELYARYHATGGLLEGERAP